jgi:hypothetical protein
MREGTMSNRVASFAVLIAAAALAACATDQRLLSGKPEYMVVGVDN